MKFSIFATIATLLFSSALAHASCPGCALDESEKDAAYQACFKYHMDHKTADDYYTERTLCREPEARKAAPAIAACIAAIKTAGYTYANSYDLCAKNLGFGAELPQYLGCYKAETAGLKKSDPEISEPTTALGNCAIKEFRDHREAVHACTRQADTLWPGPNGSPRQALVSACTDPEAKAALDDIASCTHRLAESARFDWRLSDSYVKEPASFIEKCSDKKTRDELGSILACRRLNLSAMTDAAKQAGIYENLVSGKKSDEDRDSYSREAQEDSQLDKCVTDENFRANASDILACAIENVKSFKRIPFVSTRYIDGSRSAYATLEAEDKCKTPEDRRFQHKVLGCMKNVVDRLPAGDLAELGTSDREPQEKVYTWCEMTEARELGALDSKAPCPN